MNAKCNVFSDPNKKIILDFTTLVLNPYYNIRIITSDTTIVILDLVK